MYIVIFLFFDYLSKLSRKHIDEFKDWRFLKLKKKNSKLPTRGVTLQKNKKKTPILKFIYMPLELYHKKNF